MAELRDFDELNSAFCLARLVIRLTSEAGLTYKRHPLAEERLRSAAALVKGLLHMPGLIAEHRREFLKLALWKVTEAEGRTKYETQFRSQGALSSPPGTKLEHDHVFQRSLMVDALLSAKQDAVDTIISDAVGCTITKQEHARLKQFEHLDGWDRYRAAGIVVVNTQTGELLALPKGLVE